MKRTAPVALLLATGILAGCSSTKEPLDKKLDYKSDTPPIQVSKNSLEVPPDLTAPVVQNKYNISTTGPALASAQPAAQAAAQAAAVVPTPAPASTVVATNKQDSKAEASSIHIEKAGTERWLVVPAKSPQELWPVLKAFWQDYGFIIKTEEPDLGIMETDWAENRAKLPMDGLRKLMDSIGIGGVYSTSEKDKFRIRLEKTDKGTEVYFSHRGMYETYIDEGKSETKWQPRPTDPGLEAELLGRFMIRLGQTEAQVNQQVKQVQATTDKATLPLSNGQLTLNDAFDRAWRRVGLALDRIGLVVTDRDRSQGIYYVQPAKNEETDGKPASPGFWSSLAFWKGKPNPNAAELPEYRIVLKESQAGSTQLSIQDKQGKILSDTFAKTALSKLQTELQ